MDETVITSILTLREWPPPALVAVHAIGQDLVKQAADTPTPAYSLSGTLYLAKTGWLLLAVPNALARGVFSAMNEPGVELPPAGDDGQFNAHVSVMSPEDVALIGGPDKITERGKQFAYTLGRLYSVEPDGWPGMAKVWYIKVHSPELQTLRRSYGLSGLPHGGEYDFHVSVAVKRRGVLGRNGTAKAKPAAEAAA